MLILFDLLTLCFVISSSSELRKHELKSDPLDKGDEAYFGYKELKDESLECLLFLVALILISSLLMRFYLVGLVTYYYCGSAGWGYWG